ncbi:hypothetical protein Tco_1427495 [Tanacetum coccineum]
MSDSEDSTVTYTAVSSPFGGLSDIGSQGVDGPPVMPEDPYAYVVAAFQASPSPDYVHGPEEPEQAPPLPEFVPEPVYPEFMPPEDDVLPAEEQPLPAAVSPTVNSPGYVPESDPEEDPEEVGESSSAPTARPTGGFRADYGFVATLDREIRRDPEREVGYGITDTWDEMLEDMPGTPTTDETELGRRMTNFVTTVRLDTDEIYVRLGEAQDERSLMSGRLNTLFRDRRAHAHTALLMEREARLSREAWRRSMDASDLARSEVMALRTQVVAQQSEIAGLRAADRTRQAQLVETLRLMSTLQTQVTALQSQLGPASGPAQPEIPEEAGSSS